jgi:membrane protease YdiL (CAAX protease family)
MVGNHLTSKAAQARNDYANRPCYPELIAIIVAGAFHVAAEIGLSLSIARIYNAVASLCFLVYVGWRANHTKGAFTVWGMRRDNFWTALRAQLIVAAPAVLFLLGLGFVWGSFPLPKTFWLTLGLYPLWGIAQQFALQNFIARNLTGLLSRPVAIAGAAAILFAASHSPRGALVALTLFAGFLFTLIYQRFPNLWAVGIVHGIVGALAFYIVLGEDPGMEILKWFFR